MTVEKIGLTEFNGLPQEDAAALLEELFCCPQLAARVALARPFAMVDQISSYAERALFQLPDAVVMSAVNAHPPIGGKVRPGSLSASEQAAALSEGAGAGEGGTDGDAPAPAAGAADAGGGATTPMDAIRRESQRYESVFGYRYLIRAAGLSASDILADLQQRLSNESGSEWLIVRKNLTAINELRVHNTICAERSLGLGSATSQVASRPLGSTQVGSRTSTGDPRSGRRGAGGQNLNGQGNGRDHDNRNNRHSDQHNNRHSDQHSDQHNNQEAAS